MKPGKYDPIAQADASTLMVIRNSFGRDGGPIATLHHSTESLTLKAHIAIDWIAKWAMVAGEPDGEDSSGSQKVRRMTPEEISKHACETVTACWDEFRARNWILDVPHYSDLVSRLKDQEDDNDGPR